MTLMFSASGCVAALASDNTETYTVDQFHLYVDMSFGDKIGIDSTTKWQTGARKKNKKNQNTV